jgi:O-acetyl-ADP-ribose deacetylase (regulator of RNase III)
MWSGGQQDEPDLLASAYRRSLEVTVDHSCQSVAFLSLPTGTYGYPLALAAGTALRTVMTFLREHQQPAWVRFVLFDQVTLDTFVQTLKDLGGTQEA